jgi:hypothetical protein
VPSLNSIGPFRFLQILGTPKVPTPDVEVVARAGVNDVALWFTGTRGKPFELRTFVDAPDLDSAYDLYDSYLTLIGSPPVAIVYRQIPIAAAGALFSVLHVEPLEIRAVANFMGGLNVNPQAVCRCSWTLIAKPIS